MKNITIEIKSFKRLFLLACIFILSLASAEKAMACSCVAPNTVTATAGSNSTATSVQGNWNAGTSSCGAVTDYQVDVSTSSTFTTSVSGYPRLAGGTSTNDILSGLTCNTTYYYRVKAFQACGSFYSTSWSNVITVTTAACPTGPCYDGIQNNGETGIDCGGPCSAVCPTCFDGIRNGTETGVDCGGSCALSCTPPPTTTSSCACPATANSPINPIVCAQVGTSAFDLSSGTVNVVTCGAPTPPSPAPSGCTGSGSATSASPGTWLRYDLATGVSMVNFKWNGVNSSGSGNHNAWVQFYQGTACGSLTPISVNGSTSCQEMMAFSLGSPAFLNTQVSGLDPSKDLYVYVWDDGGKALNFGLDATGAGSVPSNNTCSGATGGASTGCNVGATGDDWQGSYTEGPSNNGTSCAGSYTWGSNENTTWYTAVASSTTSTINVANVICNNGVTGNMQFAVFTNCACPEIANYGTNSCFKGCATGTGSISLSGLTPGVTYYIATDGFAGDICKFDFIAPGLILNVAYVNFEGKKNGRNVDLYWSTASETNADYFLVERTIDGENFEQLGTVSAHGNSSDENQYKFVDDDVKSNTAYYRLKQYDYDGKFAYSKLVAINFTEEEKEPVVTMNSSTNQLEITFDSSSESKYEIAIYNTLGQEVLKKDFSSETGVSKFNIDAASMKNGVYIVSLLNKNELKKYSSKFVK